MIWLIILALLVLAVHVSLLRSKNDDIGEDINAVNDFSNSKFIEKYDHLKSEYKIECYDNGGDITISKIFSESNTKEPYYLFFDVETTGLPPRTEPTELNKNQFPRIVQICWMVLDGEFNLVKEVENHIIKINGKIPERVADIHGITTEIMREKGVKIMPILQKFIEDVNIAHIAVAHNMDFDRRIIKGEFIKNRIDYSAFEEIKKICTMIAGIYYCKLSKHQYYNDGFEYKYPKLPELIKKCFFEDESTFQINGLHDAKNDIFWTAKCFQKMKNDGFL